jgi:hypothetical protein
LHREKACVLARPSDTTLKETAVAKELRPFHTSQDPIPGERDPGNLTKREPGAVSGQFAGADIPRSDHQEWLDEVTTTEHVLEGGGADALKGRKKKTTKKY